MSSNVSWSASLGCQRPIGRRAEAQAQLSTAIDLRRIMEMAPPGGGRAGAGEGEVTPIHRRKSIAVHEEMTPRGDGRPWHLACGYPAAFSHRGPGVHPAWSREQGRQEAFRPCAQGGFYQVPIQLAQDVIQGRGTGCFGRGKAKACASFWL
jgi:hypothetical protein